MSIIVLLYRSSSSSSSFFSSYLFIFTQNKSRETREKVQRVEACRGEYRITRCNITADETHGISCICKDSFDLEGVRLSHRVKGAIDITLIEEQKRAEKAGRIDRGGRKVVKLYTVFMLYLLARGVRVAAVRQ